MAKNKVIMNAQAIGRSLERLACEIMERQGDAADLALIGIQRRGVELAQRLKSVLDARLGLQVPLGKLDINLYRDDWTHSEVRPQINQTDIPFDIVGRKLILIDDVLFSGRTIRAALEAIQDFGRPAKVELLVLIDRGHRELPIQPDYVGKKIATQADEQIDVFVSELDGKDSVRLSSREG